MTTTEAIRDAGRLVDKQGNVLPRAGLAGQPLIEWPSARPSDLVEQWRAVESHPHIEASNTGFVRRQDGATYQVMKKDTRSFIVDRSPAAQAADLAFKENGASGELPPPSDFLFVDALVWSAFVKPVGQEVKFWHLDYDPLNNAVDNLRLAPALRTDRFLQSKLQEYRDRNQGAMPTGKLTESAVLEIRELHEQGVKQTAIAKMFGITPGSVSHIINRRTWSHI